MNIDQMKKLAELRRQQAEIQAQIKETQGTDPGFSYYKSENTGVAVVRLTNTDNVRKTHSFFRHEIKPLIKALNALASDEVLLSTISKYTPKSKRVNQSLILKKAA